MAVRIIYGREEYIKRNDINRNGVDRDDYEKDLRRRQEEHLRKVRSDKDIYWEPCVHDGCIECHGTGIKLNGSPCIHSISCNCPKHICY